MPLIQSKMASIPRGPTHRPPSILPRWAEIARDCGHLLANRDSAFVPEEVRATYPTTSLIHQSAWWNYKYTGLPTLSLRGDLLDALFFFCGATWGKPHAAWEMRLPEAAFGPMKDGVSQLRLDTPLGEAFLAFLGDRPTWLFPGHGPLREPTAAERARDGQRTVDGEGP